VWVTAPHSLPFPRQSVLELDGKRWLACRSLLPGHLPDSHQPPPLTPSPMPPPSPSSKTSRPSRPEPNASSGHEPTRCRPFGWKRSYPPPPERVNGRFRPMLRLSPLQCLLATPRAPPFRPPRTLPCTWAPPRIGAPIGYLLHRIRLQVARGKAELFVGGEGYFAFCLSVVWEPSRPVAPQPHARKS